MQWVMFDWIALMLIVASPFAGLMGGRAIAEGATGHGSRLSWLLAGATALVFVLLFGSFTPHQPGDGRWEGILLMTFAIGSFLLYLVVFSIGVSAAAVIARFHAWRERDLERRGEQQAAISALHAELED